MTQTTAMAGERPLSPAGVGLPELETFIAVAELGSFSLAAKRLNLSQPAVTARVQKLESTLGTRLLHRTTRSVEVSEAGQRLRCEAARALHDLRALISEFREVSAQTRRRVVVAATPMVAATLLPPILQAFHARHPEVEVRVLDLRYGLALESLERGEADFALMAMEQEHHRFRFELLTEDEIVVVMPAAHPLRAVGAVSLAALAAHPVMMLEQYTALQSTVEEACERERLRFRPGFKAGNLATLLGMVDAGSGIALLPRCMVGQSATHPRACLPVSGVALKRRYGILSLEGRELNATTRGFQEILREAWHRLPRPAELA